MRPLSSPVPFSPSTPYIDRLVRSPRSTPPAHEVGGLVEHIQQVEYYTSSAWSWRRITTERKAGGDTGKGWAFFARFPVVSVLLLPCCFGAIIRKWAYFGLQGGNFGRLGFCRVIYRGKGKRGLQGKFRGKAGKRKPRARSAGRSRFNNGR